MPGPKRPSDQIPAHFRDSAGQSVFGLADLPPKRSRLLTVLVVESAEALSMLDQCRQRPSVVVARFTAINSPLLHRVTPTCVVFSLFADGFDTLQLVSRLQDMGYRGRVIALAPPLPDRMMVLAELRNAAPGLRIDLLTRPTPASPPQAARR